MEDYSPCTCPLFNSDRVVQIFCYKITTDQVKEVFESTTAFDVDTLYIGLKSSTVFIPENILQHRRIMGGVFVSNEYGHSSALKVNPAVFHPTRVRNENGEIATLQVHPAAFHSSRNFVKEFAIYSYDLGLLSFSFLEDFNVLSNLEIRNCENVDISSLPLLPKLNFLVVNDCTGLNDWTEFPQLVDNGFQVLSITGNGLNDVSADRILKWILEGSSNVTLTYLDLSGNVLTRIPDQIKSFASLETVYLNDQQKPGFEFLSAFSFPDSIFFLNLSSSYISSIEPNTLPIGKYFIPLFL